MASVDSPSQDSSPGYPVSLNIRNPLMTYRTALEHLLRGNLDLCRSFLRLIPAGSGLKAEVATIQALLEVESGEGRLDAASDLLRKVLPISPASEPAGKILRYNLALLQQETGDLQDAEDILQEVFSQDWYFLDVRERLKSFSREEISLATCRRSLQTLAHIVFYFREST